MVSRVSADTGKLQKFPPFTEEPRLFSLKIIMKPTHIFSPDASLKIVASYPRCTPRLTTTPHHKSLTDELYPVALYSRWCDDLTIKNLQKYTL
jgi:hypothetical protein